MFVPSAIKSIQYGTVSLIGTTNTAALGSNVVLANSFVQYLGASSGSGDSGSGFGHVKLTGVGTVTGTRANTNGTLVISFVVIEFYPGFIKSIQDVNIAIASPGNGTQAVTAVVVGKTFLAFGGEITGDVSTGNATNWFSRFTLTSIILVTATTSSNQGTIIQGSLVEFR